MSIASLSNTTRISADLFAASAVQHSEFKPGSKQKLAEIDDCGNVPHKLQIPPPPPPPLSTLAHFAGAVLQTPSRFADDWCGTVPHKLPFPPPPPPPWIDGIDQMLGNR